VPATLGRTIPKPLQETGAAFLIFDYCQVKFFTNFSCERGGQLLKHRLDFEVSQITFSRWWI
jgi:hypothetical protein